MFRSCRSSRLQRFSPQRVDPKTHPFDSLRVCCTPQPAVGFTTFPCRPDPKTRSGHFPCGEDPSKRSPPRQPWTMPSPRQVLSNPSRVHRLACPLAVRAASAFVLPRCAARPADLRALFHRGVRCRRPTLPPCAARCSHGLWIDTFPDAAARFAPPSSRWTFRLAGSTPLRRPRPETSREGKVFRLRLAPCVDARVDPKVARAERVRSQPEDCCAAAPPNPFPGGNRSGSNALAPAVPEGIASAASPEPEGSGSAGGSTPRGGSTASVRFARRRSVSDEIAARPRRDAPRSSAPPRRAAPVVRARAPHPSAVARGPVQNPLAADFPRPKALVVRAPPDVSRRTSSTPSA